MSDPDCFSGLFNKVVGMSSVSLAIVYRTSMGCWKLFRCDERCNEQRSQRCIYHTNNVRNVVYIVRHIFSRTT
jgi:hypothetical protein